MSGVIRVTTSAVVRNQRALKVASEKLERREKKEHE